jgi:predicted dienelactone hydrolase
MGSVHSPFHNHSAKLQEVAFHQVKTLSWRVLQRLQKFLEAQQLPYAAHQACNLYLGKTAKVHQANCRRVLQTRLILNPRQLHSFFHTSLGTDLLIWAEQFFQMRSPENDESDLRSFLLQMAAEPEGVSLLSFLRRSDTIQLNLDQLLFMAEQLHRVLETAEQILEMIGERSAAEAAEAHLKEHFDFATLTDIRYPGSFDVQQYLLEWEVSAAPPMGLAQNRQIQNFPQIQNFSQSGDRFQQKMYCYQPIPLEANTPVIVQSHGLAASAEDLASYAEHLASYGYFVVALQHPGSDAPQVRNMLAGEAAEVFERSEFLDRPHNISQLLDELERHNLEKFAGKLNLKQVGVMGYSFGAYTAFALAGATIHFDSLEQACHFPSRSPNLSLLLQCQALGLSRQDYSLRDRRVGAILAIDSIGSSIFGDGMQKIQIPVLLIAGSQDTTAPLGLEQIRIFKGLSSPHSYLVLMRGKSHIQDMQRLVDNLNLQVKVFPQTSVSKVLPFEEYIKALSVAFFNQFLSIQDRSIPPLRADYAAYISQPPFDLWLISQASGDELQQRLRTIETLET